MQKIPAFEVVEPGILTTIQDLGRYGFSQFGVPPSGALDAFSLRVGNLLVGNREEEACLEITLMGLKIKALKEVVIAITGGDLSPTLNEDDSLSTGVVLIYRSFGIPIFGPVPVSIAAPERARGGH